MPTNTLKDKLDGHELDLSLSSLEIVPVKELKELSKATHLDLSCNLLVTIPKEFSLLTHIVRLDLSKNKLTSLPTNFGNLSKLQYLDLFQNELTTLPVSMCRLDKLRWLDVKDNPIHATLKTVAGDCLNEAQCKACAKNVVAFMKKADSAQEKERQARLQAEREQERKKKAEEEKEKEKIRLLKKQEKERKRKIHEEKLRLERQRQAEMEADENRLNGSAPKSPQKTAAKHEKSGLSCCGVFLAFLFGLAAVLFGLYYYCSINTKDEFCHRATILSQPYIQQANSTLHELLNKAHKLLKS